MKFVIQRVSHASVTVEQEIVGSIQKGVLDKIVYNGV